MYLAAARKLKMAEDQGNGGGGWARGSCEPAFFISLFGAPEII
jgi:hypothetical protein